MIRRLWLLAVVSVWPIAVLAQDGDANYVDDGHMNGYGHMMGPWGGGAFMWLLLIVVAGVLIYFAVKGLGPGASGPSLHETPLDVLKKRYARGEITKEQFDEIKKDL